jgi:hypothetical protein
MECPGRTEQRYVNDPESPKIPWDLRRHVLQI